MAKRKTHTVGRDAETGQFITVDEARSRPKSTVVERVPNPGHSSDTKPGKKGK